MQLRKLYNDILDISNPIVAREVITVANGFKSMRTHVNQNEINNWERILTNHGLSFQLSNEISYLLIEKNNSWSNLIIPKNAVHKYPTISIAKNHSLYISIKKKELSELINSDLNRDDEKMGSLLSIPSCCIKFFCDNYFSAYKNNLDFIPIIFNNTIGKNNYWCNIISQYFNYSLISHFPCSFNCSKTIDIAKKNYLLLKENNINDHTQFLNSHKSHYIYTVKDGIAKIKYPYKLKYSKIIESDSLEFANSNSKLRKLFDNKIEFKKLCEKYLALKKVPGKEYKNFAYYFSY